MLKVTTPIVACLLSLITITAMSQVPTAKSLKEFDLKPGTHEVSFKLNNSDKWKMMVSVPETVTEQPVRLVLALHWGVGSASYGEFMRCLILPAFGQKNYLIVAPEAERQVWWRSPKEQQLIGLIKGIKQHWPVDKVIVTGYSDGGTGSIFLANKYPEHFDGAIGIAGFYFETEEFRAPTYVVHGRGDQLFSYERSKRIMDKAQAQSKHLKFITSEELTHYEACRYVAELEKGIAWIENILN